MAAERASHLRLGRGRLPLHDRVPIYQYYRATHLIVAHSYAQSEHRPYDWEEADDTTLLPMINASWLTCLNLNWIALCPAERAPHLRLGGGGLLLRARLHRLPHAPHLRLGRPPLVAWPLLCVPPSLNPFPLKFLCPSLCVGRKHCCPACGTSMLVSADAPMPETISAVLNDGHHSMIPEETQWRPWRKKPQKPNTTAFFVGRAARVPWHEPAAGGEALD